MSPAGPETSRHVLAMSHVSKTYSRSTGLVRALDDVSVFVGEVETVALVGESGSGKTTLGRVALGLVRPEVGTVSIGGEERTAAAGAKGSNHLIQPVFQDSSGAFNPRKRVSYVLEQAMRRTGAPRSRAEMTDGARDALETVGLAPGRDYMDRYPRELSGGQRQRLGIARAICAEPRVVVADEPLSGADASVRGQVLNLLERVQTERGISYLFITHDIAVAREFASRLYVMSSGRVVESGPSASVVDDPVDPYTQRLIASVPTI